MHHLLKSLLLAWAVGAVLSSTATAAIIQIGNYGLGEAGTVGASAPFNPLIDSISPANNITSFQAGGGGGQSQTIITTGLAAPDSTAALQKVAGVASGWFGGANYNLNDNWALDVWIRPDSNTGTVAMATNNSATGLSFWYQNSSAGHDVVVGQGTGTTVNELIDGPVYTLGAWQRLTLITRNGEVNFYVDEVLQGSAAVTDRYLNNIMLGFGPGGNLGTSAAYDEMKVYSFDGTSSLATIESVVFNTPEPATIVMWLLGGCVGITWTVYRRWQR